MQLYRLDLAWAPNPRRVSIYLAEKGLAVPWTELKSAAMDHKADWFLALNPAGKVPVLVLDDGTAICDSGAIVEYFEDVSPGPTMIGNNSSERAVVRSVERMSTDLLWLAAVVARNTHEYFANWGGRSVSQSADAASYARPRAAALMTAIDASIGSSTFAAGPNVTIADCTLKATVDFLERFASMPITPQFPNLFRWNQSFHLRPSCAEDY